MKKDVTITGPIATASKPPTDPALPPVEVDPRRKAAEDRIARGPEREARAKALELAVSVSGITAQNATVEDVLALAERFRAYILDGLPAESEPTP